MTDRETGGELSPDELEQRQRADGTYEDETTDEDLAGLTPDEIEQRQVVENDEDDEPRDD